MSVTLTYFQRLIFLLDTFADLYNRKCYTNYNIIYIYIYITNYIYKYSTITLQMSLQLLNLRPSLWSWLDWSSLYLGGFCKMRASVTAQIVPVWFFCCCCSFSHELLSCVGVLCDLSVWCLLLCSLLSGFNLTSVWILLGVTCFFLKITLCVFIIRRDVLN